MTYLKDHFVKDNGYCIEYNTVKACIIGSVNGQITYYNNPDKKSYDDYFRFGLTSKEYHEQYKNHPNFEILPFF